MDASGGAVATLLITFLPPKFNDNGQYVGRDAQHGGDPCYSGDVINGSDITFFYVAKFIFREIWFSRACVIISRDIVTLDISCVVMFHNKI